MADTSSFSWFDLSKYDSVDIFDIDDWSYQLAMRRYICFYTQANSELIESFGVTRWENVGKRARKNITLIKDEPIFTYEKSKRRFLSVMDTIYSDLYFAGFGNKGLKNVFNLSEADLLTDIRNIPVIPKPDIGSFFGTAMLTIDLGATDEQLKNDFNQWLKNHRAITKYQVRGKKFTSKDFEKWSNKKVLPYLDLSLIANAEDKQLTQNMLGRLLFPNEYNVDLTERIRRSVKPLAESLLDNRTLKALSKQAMAT